MAKGRARRSDRPEIPMLPPARAGAEESPARLRLRQEQLHRAELRLTALLERILAAEERVDEKIRTANSLTKSLVALNREAEETVLALQGAIRFIASENTAEIIAEEVASAVSDMHESFRKASKKKVEEIQEEYDRLREIMIHVRDRKGKRLPPGTPNLLDMVSGMALEALKERE